MLSGAHYGGTASGEISVDGQPMADWVRSGGTATYVMQTDVLPHLDTPREALTLSALLRLPRTMSREHKLARVEALLDVLVRAGLAAGGLAGGSQPARGPNAGPPLLPPLSVAGPAELR